MKRCELQNPSARNAVAAVWRHLRAHFPADARFLAAIVKRIVPVAEADAEGGDCGQWLDDAFLSLAEQIAWYERFGDEHGRGYGTMKLLDSDALSTLVVAHEMGHAFTSDEDLDDRGGPDEWNSEAAADMHAVRWGLLTLEDIRHRFLRNLGEQEDETCGAAWTHHGPVPGGDWFEDAGVRWRLGEDFVFERGDS